MKGALAAVTLITIAACDEPHVSGRVCIVVDLRYPTQCLGGQDVAELSVEEIGTGIPTVTDFPTARKSGRIKRMRSR